MAALAATAPLWAQAAEHQDAPVVVKGRIRVRPAAADPLPPLDMFVKAARIEKIALSADGTRVAFTTHVDDSHLLALYNVEDGSKKAIKLADEPLSTIGFVGNDHLMVAHTSTGLRSTCPNGVNQQAQNSFATMQQRPNVDLKDPNNGPGSGVAAVESALAFSTLSRLKSPACIHYGARATSAIIVVDLKAETATQIGTGMSEYHHAALDLPAVITAGGKTTLNGAFLELRGESMNEQPTQRVYLWQVDPVTGNGRMVDDGGGDLDRNFRYPDDWLLDAQGNPVARSVYDYAKETLTVERREGKKWKPVLSRKLEGRVSFAPQLMGYGIDGQSIVIMDRKTGGSYGYFELSPEGELREFGGDALYDRIIFHPATGRAAGMARFGESPAYALLDPGLSKVYAAAAESAPGEAVTVVATAKDPRRMIISTQGDVDAGGYYYLDLAKGSFVDLGNDHPAIPAEWIARQSVVTYQSADGLEINAILTVPSRPESRNLPLVVLPHDGPQGHDAQSFNWLAQSIASRGFAVLQPNYRGSDNAGAAFVAAGYGEWSGKMLSDLSDGARYLAAEGIADPKRVCIVGSGYGGYAALSGAVAGDGVYRCAVSIGGISDIPAYTAWVHAHRPLPDPDDMGGLEPDKTWPRALKPVRGSEATLKRYLGAGAPSPTDRAEQIVPTLLLHGENDQTVPPGQSRTMRDAAKGRAEYVQLTDCDHELTKETCRLQTAQAVTDFLLKWNP
ncbi:hypothetical protein ABAC460_20235 [Asticcacaulis sp. AC460]|nr:hypothetical protein ABAC460_20235 [Asticcacaulis sp. AC460]